MTITSGPSGSIGETEAAALIAGESLLSRDDIPDENQQIHCFSCGETMTGLFCHACGQKNDDYRRSIISLVTETFASIFSLENRMWRTWAVLLLKPGKVSREYSDGMRTHWTSPVRIYLALSIILFGYMSLTETRIFSIRTDIVPKEGFQGPAHDLNDASVELKPDFGFFRRQAVLDRLNEDVDFKRASKIMRGIPRQAFIFDGNTETIGISPSDEVLASSGSWPTSSQSKTANLDVTQTEREQAIENYSSNVETIVKSYNQLLSAAKSAETIADRIIKAEQDGVEFDLANELHLSANDDLHALGVQSVQKLDDGLTKLGLTRSDIHKLPVEIRTGFNIGIVEMNGTKLTQNDIQNLIETILRNPAVLNEGISKYLPRIMFLMMPFAAIISLVFIRGKKTALLYDHLVHATYIHAVTFAFLFVLILLAQWTSLPGLMSIFFIGIAMYLPLSAKAMFKRGWFKTFFASYSIAFVYGLVMLMVLTALTAGSVREAVTLAQL